MAPVLVRRRPISTPSRRAAAASSAEHAGQTTGVQLGADGTLARQPRCRALCGARRRWRRRRTPLGDQKWLVSASRMSESKSGLGAVALGLAGTRPGPFKPGTCPRSVADVVVSEAGHHDKRAVQRGKGPDGSRAGRDVRSWQTQRAALQQRARKRGQHGATSGRRRASAASTTGSTSRPPCTEPPAERTPPTGRERQ